MNERCYINLGRWAAAIVGPFDNYTIAHNYIENLDWRGARPKVVGIAPPDPDKLRDVTNVTFQLSPTEYNELLVAAKNSPTVNRTTLDRLVEQSPTPW